MSKLSSEILSLTTELFVVVVVVFAFFSSHVLSLCFVFLYAFLEFLRILCLPQSTTH